METLEPSYSVGGNIKRYSVLGKSLTVPQKVQHGVTIRPISFIARYLPKRNENIYSHGTLYINVHSSIINNSQKEEKKRDPKSPITDK